MLVPLTPALSPIVTGWCCRAPVALLSPSVRLATLANGWRKGGGSFRRVALGLGLALMLAAGLGCGGQPDPFARRLPKPTPTPAPWQRGFQPDPSLRQSSNALPAPVAGLSATEVRHGR